MAAPTEIRCPNCGRATTTADRFCGVCGARLDVDNATPAGELTGPPRPHVDRILAALRTATIGEYDVAGEIGRGGMAVVFLAHDLSLNRKVAIKALLPELLYTEGMDRRFKHEARIAAKLDHPNILVIHGVREANDLLFIVMKLVDGLPLSAIAKVSAPLPIAVVRFVLRHVAEALAYAHDEGVVHRDVKPANIMVDRRGNVVVMDFGIAKAADDAQLTRTGLVIGTPAYMSPEQCLAQGVSPASDQYSLGVVAFELLTGKTPFRGSPLEMQWAHATAPPPSVRSLRPDCPPELEALIERMLAKAPADRWPSLHEVAHALGDDPATAAAARTTLVALANEAPGRRDATLPTTPASPLPFGAGPAGMVDATTDPFRLTGAGDANFASSRVGPPNVGSVAGPMLTLSQQRIQLQTGDAVEMIVELDATDSGSDAGTIAWETNRPEVATVSADGVVTAVSPGLAEIACTWRGKRAVCVVQVGARIAVSDMRANATDVVGATVMSRVSSDTDLAAALPVTSRRQRSRRPLWIGIVAAAVAGVALYASVQPDADSNTSVVADSVRAPATIAATTTVGDSAPPPSRPPATRGDTVAPNVSTPPPAPPVGAPKTATPTRRTASSRPAEPAGSAARVAANTPTPQPTPPAVPLARPDTTRIVNRTDTSNYANRSNATPVPAAPTPGYPAPTPARDSVADRSTGPTREIAAALFREFANTINTRTYSRITSAYTQPSDPAEVKLWQEFLVFVRDYTPRATARSATIDASTNPPTITASIDFRWSGDAGYDRSRQVTFVGYGVPIPDGWQLRGVRLSKKFW
jgi:serine/threonine-protein kinase